MPQPPEVETPIMPTLQLSQTSATLYTKIANTLQLKATVEGPSKEVLYTSSNTNVATVDKKTGKVMV